jgi:hypothetical protein
VCLHANTSITTITACKATVRTLCDMFQRLVPANQTQTGIGKQRENNNAALDEDFAKQDA